jgi:hypothetical protein
MVEPDEILTPPIVHAESRGQRVATSSEQRALIAKAETSEYLSESLSGIVADQERLSLNQAGATVLLTTLRMNEKARDEAVRERDAEKKTREEMQDRAHKAELRVSAAEGKLDTVDLRLLLNSVGCVLLGLTPYAHEKMQWGGSLTVGIVGLVLVFGALLIGRKRRSS